MKGTLDWERIAYMLLFFGAKEVYKPKLIDNNSDEVVIVVDNKDSLELLMPEAYLNGVFGRDFVIMNKDEVALNCYEQITVNEI